MAPTRIVDRTRARAAPRRRGSRRRGDDVRVGLVLGAGGVLGGAWLTGALQAICAETGWDPGSAEHIVGTSAGAMVGGLLACAVPPWFMVAYSAGERPVLDTAGLPVRPDRNTGGAGLRLHRGRPSLGPGSWRLAASSLARPYRHSPAALLAAWLPGGPFSTEPLKETIRRVCPQGWAPHPNCWAMAVDHGSGELVAFGAPGERDTDLADAVAASCAVPGFFRPVAIGGRRFVDGGVRSVSNADVLVSSPLDLVVVLNPMSSLHAEAPRTLGERAAYVIRQRAGRRLGTEAKRLRAAGIETILIQPTVHDLDAMGSNLMNRRRRHDVARSATETVTAHLRETPIGERLGELPAGQPELVRRPPGPLRRQPDFEKLAAGRFGRLGRTRSAQA